MGRAGRTISGLLAAVVIAVLVLGVPVFLARSVGNPWPGRAAWQLRDEQEILLGLLTVAAWLVWARFVVALGREAGAQVGALRRDRSAKPPRPTPPVVAGPPPPSAGGAFGTVAHRLVAAVLVLVPATQLAPDGAAGSLPSRPLAAATATVTPRPAVPPPIEARSTTSSEIEVQPNDSLFRIAERHLGDRSRWREILELNQGRTQPDGGQLTTPSSLRSGWWLQLPADAIVTTDGGYGVVSGDAPAAAHSAVHVVQAGESYWVIAEDQLEMELRRTPTSGEVAARTQELMRVNAAQLGAVDPAMLHPGDEVLLDPPVARPLAADAATHLVQPGESYWEITEVELTDSLGHEPNAAEIVAGTHALTELNAPLFDYADPAMLHPGDEVVLPPELARGALAPAIPSLTPAEPGITDPTADIPAAADPDVASAAAAGSAAADPTAADPSATDLADAAQADEFPSGPVPSDRPAVGPDSSERSASDAATAIPAPDEAGPADAAPGLPVGAVPSGAATDPPAATSLPPPTRPSPSRGDVIVAPAPPPPPTDMRDLLGHPTPDRPRHELPLGLGAAVLLAGGAIALVDARRRAALRRSQAHDRLVDIPPSGRTEAALRAVGAPERLLRIDVVLRALAASLREQHAQPLVLLVHPDGAIEVRLSGAAVLPPPWTTTADGVHRLSGSVTIDDLLPAARTSGLPCPALVDVGTSAGADVYVDVEAVGALQIDAPPTEATAIIEAIALGLVVSPFAIGASLALVGLDRRITDARPDADVADVASAVSLARSTVCALATATDGGATTFELRSRSTLERWEPAIVAVAPCLARDATDGPRVHGDLVELASVAAVGVAVVASEPMGTGAVLARDGDGWVLQPWRIPVEPIGIEPGEVAAVVQLIEDAEREPFQAGEPVLLPPPAADDDHAVDFVDRDWELMVRVLGGVRVHDAAGVDVAFQRNKAQELVCWLALHRVSATRTGARTALWETDVRDATFANVVSDARRNLARTVAPAESEEWIGRTLTESLPLHVLVVTDADLLRARVAAARQRPAAEAIELLRPGLALVTDLPFAGTGYSWPDPEGLVTDLVLLATTAAVVMARHCLELGDVDGVFWATGQGLRVLPGHEELVALRMRAHACQGDLAAVRAEWGSYERALAADAWSDAEPAAKLVELRRELLGSTAGRPTE